MKYITYIQDLQKLILVKYAWKTCCIVWKDVSFQLIEYLTGTFYKTPGNTFRFHIVSENDYTGKSGYIAIKAPVSVRHLREPGRKRKAV